jgi:hypothetical protein
MLHKLVDSFSDSFGFTNADLMCCPKEHLQAGIG